jgi:hypothetical protein
VLPQIPETVDVARNGISSQAVVPALPHPETLDARRWPVHPPGALIFTWKLIDERSEEIWQARICALTIGNARHHAGVGAISLREIGCHPATKSGSSGMRFLSTGDLVTRWKYTRQGINLMAKKPKFPPPAFRLNNGRLPVWELSAIEAFERDRPELGDEHQKFRKRDGYYAAILKGDKKQGLA